MAWAFWRSTLKGIMYMRVGNIIAITALFIFLAVFPEAPLASPIGAKAVYLRGTVYVEPAGAARKTVEAGMAFAEGDKIVTMEDGIVEVMLENGNLIRIDSNTVFVIKALSKNDETNDTTSIFNLILGRVKSSVAKLATSGSKYEYTTTTAVVGVAGTPPWVTEFDGKKTLVELLGMEGEEGKVYVKGNDPMQTIIYLLANSSTTVHPNMPPDPPSPISEERRRWLDRIIPFSFRSQDKSEGEKGGQPQAGAPEMSADDGSGEGGGDEPSSGPDGAGSLVNENISNSISMPVKPRGAALNSVSGASRMGSTEQGTVGEVGGAQQAPTTAQFQIQINF